MGCFDAWSKNYYQIINRYESTIVGQFFGHTHYDQFEMFYDLNNLKRAVGVAYIAGSITTFSHGNPNYRIYNVDGIYNNSSFQVLDHENYFMNLTDANINMKTTWQREYSAKVYLLNNNNNFHN
jgi:sphingomyelin phosphodiesterase